MAVSHRVPYIPAVPHRKDNEFNYLRDGSDNDRDDENVVLRPVAHKCIVTDFFDDLKP